MSNDNFAIEIDPPDDVDFDVEANINSSTCALMHNFEEERPTSLVASIRESARSSKRKVSYYCSFIFSPIKKLLSSFKLLIIIGLYAFAGAHLFMYLEVPTDLEAKEDGFHQRKIAREVMVLNLRAIYYDNREDREERWKHAILKFEADMGLEEPVVETAWTFWMSFLYAGTIFTTIGYGNIACKTRAGQVATMAYAFAGIPIMLVMLTSLNNFLLKWIKIITNGFCDICLYAGVRLGIAAIRQEDTQKRLRYTNIARKMNKWKLTRQDEVDSVAIRRSEENKLNSTTDEEEEEQVELDPPVFATLFATVSWIMLSAAVFCIFEDWSFFTSFYFCFISLTTIGLGDVTPANPEYMIATFGVVLIGLSMLTVCIDVIKEKLALMYMAMLQKLLKDYMEAVKSGDPNATNAMMAGFQGKGKYLMQFISKNDGAKVMNKFKEDCSKKGIDPPPVLTNINPETGMPAFANASREEFNDYIEVADERFAEEQQKLIAQTPLSKSTDFLSPPSRRASVSVGITQTAPPVPRVSLEVQAGTTIGKFHDYGSQTTHNESSDEGIQTDCSLDFDFDTEKIRKEPEKLMTDTGTQYEIVLLTSIGIQPEVSSIYHGAEFDEHSSGEDEESGCESENEEEGSQSEEEEGEHTPTYQETSLPFEVADPGMLALGLQSPPIEITPFTDDESGTTSESRSSPSKQEAAPAKLTPAKVEKSASMDSTDTVIHVKPEKMEQTDKRERRKKKKKLKTKKAREHELRFLKNTGNQTSPILMDCATQYELFTTESASQYDVKGRSRKCQTKLSSINHEQLQGIRETVQKLKRRESEMSRVTNVSESEWESESGREPEVAEVSLDLSVIALGVDESGRVVEVPRAAAPPIPTHSTQPSLSPTSEQLEELKTTSSEATSAEKVHLGSEDEEIESLEELELFSTDTGVQTEERETKDKQEHANPTMLEVVKNSTTQTTFSTFHLPQKVYESASTSSEEEEDKEEDEEGSKESSKVQKSKSEVFFMTETGVQTMHTSFHLSEHPKLTEETQKVGFEEEGSEKPQEDLPLFLKDSECQTAQLASRSCTTSTEDVRFAEVRETSEVLCQVQSDVQDSEVQTFSHPLSESTMQTDEAVRKEGEVQTEKEESEVKTQTEGVSSLEIESQTETTPSVPVECQTDSLPEHSQEALPRPETSSSICQTESPSQSEAEVQATATVESAFVECQTDSAHLEEVEVQTVLETSVSESQTENTEVGNNEVQTESTEATSSESQTEKHDAEDTEMQTDEKEILSSESQTESVLTGLRHTQTDDVALVGDVAVIDNVAQSESPEVVDSGTQHTTSFEDRDVQAAAISLDHQTQHSIQIDAKSCQTEIVTTRNRRSQDEEENENEESGEKAKKQLAVLKIDSESQVEVDTSSINLSPIRIDMTHSFTMTERGNSEEKEVQVDEESFESAETTQKYYSGPLWSDFDYTPVLGEEDEEVMDGETQTEDGSEPADPDEEGVRRSTSSDLLAPPPPITRSSDSLTDEFAVQCSPESSDVKTQTVKFKKRIEEKNVEAKVETSTSTVQATTETCEQSAGSIGEDDWLQVYVQELDEERRLRMSDIGIQTGVLARVQHMYTRPISDDVGATSSAPITLRKSSDSSENISAKTAKSSEESLAPSASGTALSAAESMDDRLWAERASPFASRASSMKRMKRGKSAQDVEKDKSNIVHDLRAKFEMKSPTPRSPPKDGEEGSSAFPSSKRFF